MTARPLPSEYQGKFRDNTLPAKARGDNLTSQERLRLKYLTGQTDDPTVPPTSRAWQGLKKEGQSVVDR